MGNIDIDATTRLLGFISGIVMNVVAVFLCPFQEYLVSGMSGQRPFQHSHVLHDPGPLNSSSSAVNSSMDTRHLLLKARSTDVEWAIICMTALLVLLVLGVCYSQMWRHKDNYSWYSSQHTNPHQPHDLFVPPPQLSIKELLRTKLKHLSSLTKMPSKFKKKLRDSKNRNGDYVLVDHQGGDHVCVIDDSLSEDEVYSR